MNYKNLDFSGENIYVGIDTHAKNWVVSLETDEVFLKTFSQDSDPDKLFNYLRRNFPGANYHAAYEAGCFGYWICEALNKYGVNCYIINPADIPTSDKEKKQKRDRIDSRKIARTVKNRDFNSVYVPSQKHQGFRTLIRTHRKLVKDIARCKIRIKAHLQFWGIKLPDEFQNTRNLTQAYVIWLRGLDEKHLPCTGKKALDALIDQGLANTKILKELKQEIKQLPQSEKPGKDIALLKTIPGIGETAAREIMAEIIDIKRFKSIDHLKSYVGLIPTSHSSGEKEYTGQLTKRGNAILKSMLTQCSWRALRYDSTLLKAYKEQLKAGKKSNKALIQIACKLLNRIRYVLKNRKPLQINEMATA